MPQNVQQAAQGLIYRDLIVVGLLLKKLKIQNETSIRTLNNIVPDSWIYIQERDVKVARLQILNNWSPYMVKDGNTVWIGAEYLCNEKDDLWCQSNQDLAMYAVDELSRIDIIERDDVLDHVVVRMPKSYPAYFGTYDQLHVIQDFTDQFKNLFLIGRNGMHRYDSQDDSMLSAMIAVENIINGVTSKDNIWCTTTEEQHMKRV